MNESKKRVILYTDGACSGNPGLGGYAGILMYGEARREYSGSDKSTTNNRMEVMAVIEGLKRLKYPCAVEIYSDSAYTVNAFVNGWIYGWKKKGWKTKLLLKQLLQNNNQLCLVAKKLFQHHLKKKAKNKKISSK